MALQQNHKFVVISYSEVPSEPRMNQKIQSSQNEMSKDMDMKKHHVAPLCNEMLNPNQISYPNVVGFNDLHIEAIRHLAPHGDNSKLKVNVHHHCKVYDDMTAVCL